MVANHVSWLDIPVLGAQTPTTFVSKSEVRSWPLIGWLAVLLNTIFLERGAHQASACARQVGDRIKRGLSVVIFPEGTTTDGRGILPFYPRLFAAAQNPGIWIQPVALRYLDQDQPCPVAPFVGDDALIAHLLRILRQPRLVVEVHFLDAFPAEGLSRKDLAEGCRTAIAERLGVEETP